MPQNLSADKFIALPDRAILRLSGTDKINFLQGIITNDVEKLGPIRALYSCLLTPQGRFLHDFLVIPFGDDWLIDCEAPRRADLLVRLQRYRLRAKIELWDETSQWQVFGFLGAAPPPSKAGLVFRDPRHAAMGWRIYQPPGSGMAADGDWGDYETRRLQLGIPDGSRDMAVEKALPMEYHLDKFQGISLNKGCYLGQEMTSRMFFRDLIKRQTYPVKLKLGEGQAIPAPGTVILNAAGEEVGELRSSYNHYALAYLKIGKENDALTAHEIPLAILSPVVYND